MPTVVLIGNPNTGKSTLFGDLVGIHQHVGNYPGVTVEKKTGRFRHDGRDYELIDLPGLYSLAARSRDEMVVLDVLLGQTDAGRVDAVLSIVDAGNLERHFYLLSQVLELGLPLVVAVNMMDVAASRGMTLDLELLERRLGVPVVPIQAHRGIGLQRLKSAVAAALTRPAPPRAQVFPEAFAQEVDALVNDPLPQGEERSSLPTPWPRWLVQRVLLDTNGYLQHAVADRSHERARQRLDDARDRLAAAGCPVPGVESKSRHGWIRSMLNGAVRDPSAHQPTTSDRIDRVLTHRLWGTLVFVLVMVLMFQSVFVWAKPMMGGIEAAIAALGVWIETLMSEGTLRSLLVEGLLGGVGGVLVFLPQILVLFFFVALLEDCGYMARAAYLMDRVMARVGLSGRSFIPMLSSFACSVPGIMAARVIDNERDRLTTILVAPLLTCSARLPVYALLIAAFIPAHTYLGGLLNLQGLTLTALYLLGMLAAVIVAKVLKLTVLRGQTPQFLLELPGYKWPSPRIVLYRMAERGWIFLRTAGTLILAVSIIVWAALHYPRDDEAARPLIQRQEAAAAELEKPPPHDPRSVSLAEEAAQLRHEIAAVYQQRSLLGRLGRLIEPAVRPLGWDWRIGCAVLASFPAREVVVATLGVIYGLGSDLDAESAEGAGQLQAKLRAATWDDDQRPVFTIPVALSIMVFFALCAQCAATLAVIRRETNSWRWPMFAFAYMTTLAYIGALLTYQAGAWLAG